MTLAVAFVAMSVLALVLILGWGFSASLQLSSSAKLAQRIHPLDIEAFRNLIDPAETAYLRRRLPAIEFYAVQRERLRATAAYIQLAACNASVLVEMAKPALLSPNPQTAQAAHQLIDSALLLNRNAQFAVMRIRVLQALPFSCSTGERILHGYERLSGTAMLLGRLQSPAVPVRVSVR